MIYVQTGGDVVAAYIYECYRRLYAVSINKDGELGDFDLLKIQYKNVSTLGEISYDIPYDDWYCEHKLQTSIIDEVIKEKYVYIGYATKHKLKQHQMNSIRASVCLGCSPFSSAAAFVKKYPSAKKYIKDEDFID